MKKHGRASLVVLVLLGPLSGQCDDLIPLSLYRPLSILVSYFVPKPFMVFILLHRKRRVDANAKTGRVESRVILLVDRLATGFSQWRYKSKWR